MIGKLTGKIDTVFQNTLILDVSGVGYRVILPTKTIADFSGIGQTASLFIHTHVREEVLDLYGFASLDDLALFEKLLSVSGVGAKTALSLLSSGSAGEIRTAIANADVDFFRSIPGIGKKTAERLIVELKSSFGEIRELDLAEKHLPAFQETLAALKQFGFSATESRAALREVKNAKELNSPELIKESLKLLGK